MLVTQYYAHGKLLLTGEYAVLDGANALAIPTRFGQHLQVRSEAVSKDTQRSKNRWQAINNQGEVWLTSCLDSSGSSELEKNQFIIQLIELIQKEKPALFEHKILDFTSRLEFPNNWGLGSSSTLISLLATWSQLDPYYLLENSFGGSGYDIACATSKSPIVYTNKIQASWEEVGLSSNWTNYAYFVFLEKKKDSREAIQHYRSLENTQNIVAKIDSLTANLIACTSVSDAMEIIAKHEELMSSVLNTPSINETHFSDFSGFCKSLGAWGGDFIMAISNGKKGEVENYFKSKGLHTMFSYNDMIWKEK